MRVALILCMVSGCGNTPKQDSGRGAGDKLGAAGPWTLVTDEIEGGVLLSAWSDGPTLRVVGGDLGGGEGIMVYGDADELCVERSLTDRALWWIHGSREGHWTAVGEAGTVLREVDGARTRMDVPTDATLYGVFDDGSHTWVAGGVVGSGVNRGEIWRHDGEAWTAVATDLPHVLFKVWGPWFVGQDIAYRWNTETEALDSFELDGRLLTVSGTSDADIWAVGGLASPLVLHFSGEAFDAVDTTGLGGGINGVYTAPGETVWLAGNYGLTAHKNDTGWVQPERPLTTDHMHAVWRHGGATWWLGGDLFNTGDNHGTIIRYSDDGRRPAVTDCE